MSTSSLSRLLFLFCLLPSLLFAAEQDPWEGANRKVFQFNEELDRVALKPAAKAYRQVSPQFFEDGMGNFFENIAEPKTMINALLQGKPGVLGKSLARFTINSTVGFLGFFDVAQKLGLGRHKEDFGQTFAVWGVPSGPYIMLPFLGPSTIRDGVGRVPDWFYSLPAVMYEEEYQRYIMTGVDVVDSRARLLSAESLVFGDRYTFIRDAYLQNREYEIKDGVVKDSFGDTEFEEFDF